MNRRNFLISGGTALAGLFLANGTSRLDADSHAAYIDEYRTYAAFLAGEVANLASGVW